MPDRNFLTGNSLRFCHIFHLELPALENVQITTAAAFVYIFTLFNVQLRIITMLNGRPN